MNNDSTISLIVEQGFDKPYLYNGKAYRRSDTSTVEVDKLELRRLILEGKNIDFDKLPCHIKFLSFVRLEELLKKTLGQPLFEVGDDFVCVTLPVITGAAPLNDDELLVLSKMPTRQLLTRSDVDKKTGFEKTKTIRILNSLEAKGLIKITGKGRGCRYMKV